MKNLNKILRYLIPYWGKAVANISFNLLSVLFSLFSVYLLIPFLGILFGNQEPVTELEPFKLNAKSVEQYFNYYVTFFIQNYGTKITLAVVSGFMIVTALFRNVFRYLAMYYLAPIRNGVVRDIRDQIFRKILQLPLPFFSEEKKGDIMSRMTSDVKEIEISIVSSLEMLFRDPLTIVIYLTTLLFMSPQLTIFVFILLPVSGFIIGRIGKSLKKTSLRGQQKMGGLLSIIEETLTGLRIIKAFNSENRVERRFTNHNKLYYLIMVKMFRRRYMANPISEFLGIVVMVIIMWFGATLVLNDVSKISAQEFIGYLALFYLIIEPAKSFTGAYYNVQKGLASVERIDTILTADIKITEKKDAKPIKVFNQAIEYKNVYFRYEKEYVLKDINLTIEKGKSIALVGQSGAGKSTIADLLPRFYDVTKGDILIDGISIRDYKIVDLRALMGNVNQEPILFNESFFNNIAFGSGYVKEEDVERAAKVANAHEFIINTARGYYTNIGDRGNKLSGGQKQRISIARAVLKNPPILILDEATSSLDTESERLVQEALLNLMKNRTTLVIAHRLSTVQHADEIIVLHEGKIAERGQHKSLLKKNGIYRKLHDLQIFD